MEGNFASFVYYTKAHKG